jgi:hypothetical protein
MGRASIVSTNFTGGELSPAIALGRFDIAKYNNGARRLENCSVTVQGGAKRRPGTRFIAATKTQTKVARLVDFIYNRDQAYILEMGEGYIRFYRDREQLLDPSDPFEVASPYTEAQLPSVNYVQKADTGFFVHEGVFPYRLQRYSDTNWGMGVVPFITPAFEEQGHFPAVEMQFTAPDAPVQPGVGITLNSAAPVFLKSDVGRSVTYGGGSALITAYISSVAVTTTVTSTFARGRDIPVGEWNLTGTPQDSISPSSQAERGQIISLNANYTYLGAQVTITAIVSGVGVIAINATAHGFITGDTVTVTGTGFGDGTWVIRRLNANQFDYPAPVPSGFFSTTGLVQKIDVSTDSEVWRAEDVGKIVSVNGGVALITSVVNVGTANAKVLRPVTSIVPAGVGAWTLESVAWNAQKGYPRAVTINKQRLLFAGSPGYPQHVWASGIQEYLNFEFGTADDEAFRFELDGPRNSPIRHLAPARQLLVLTEADEMSLKGGQEKPITPTNIQKTDESTVGASAVRPVKIGSEIVFTQAAGRKVSAIGYRYEIDGFSSPDRTVFASHITGEGISQIAHQKEPDSTLYAIREDGQMAVCAYDIDQEVTGWGRWITDGSFESIATIPTSTGEDAYTIVKRTIDGDEKRYVEVFDPEMLVDCGITGYNAGGQATWTGLDHLEGKVVQVWADGAHAGQFTVEGGSITLPQPRMSVQIGLGFTPLVEMLQPELGGNGTTAQGSQVHVSEVIVRVLDTSAVQINGEDVPFRRFGSELLDQPPPEYSGDVRKTTLSDTIFTTSQIITQPYPLPFHLLDVIRRVTLNEG